MKVAVVVLFAFLVAGAAASVHQIHPVHAKLDKSIIDDALALYECLMKSIAILQDSIHNLVLTVSGVTDVLQGIQIDFNACLAIGGDNPSLGDLLEQASCILGVAGSIRETITNTINDVQNSVGQVVIAGNNVLACFESN